MNMNFPELNETVICKITKITDFGVFAELLEYDNIEGFIHISQVSSTWIKNIHNHAKINQIRAAKVLKVDAYKNHVDLSLSRVSAADQKRKISEYRLYLRAQGLLKVVAKEMDITYDDAWKEIAEPILEVDNSLYKGFVNILKYGIEKYSGINKKYHKQLVDILSKNITVKNKNIVVVLKISSKLANGIEVIKKVLLKVLDSYEGISISYLGAGNYELIISAVDYKAASKTLDIISKDLNKSFKKKASLEIIEKKQK